MPSLESLAAPDATPLVIPSSRSITGGTYVALPRPLTDLVARNKEVATIASLLRATSVRLLTLTGPGGVGKTRLAIGAAAEAAKDFPDGVVFIDLSPVSNPDLVLNSMARCLGVRDTGAETLHSRLLTAIGTKRLLLVLDNFEQIVTAASQLREILDVCPEVTMLITSRIRLRLSGEREYPVAPLPLEEQVTVEDDEASGAVRLFLDRARAVLPEFNPGTEEMPAIVEIVRRVDGLPLAIELAAARIKALPLETLLQRMQQRLPLLSGGARDLPLRQQTMRGTLGWSYDLLSDEEQVLFRRLAVFVGGFTLEAAEAIGSKVPGSSRSVEPCTSIGVIDVITALIEHSLLRLNPGSNQEPRYQMLEIVREYALELLDASGEAEIIRRRHADYFLEFTEAAGWELDRAHTIEQLQPLGADYDNIRATMSWLAHPGESDALLRMARSLSVYWILRGPYEEGRAWLERALVHDTGSPMLRGVALYGLGVLAVNQDDIALAETCFAECLAIAQTLGSPEGLTYAWFGLGLLEMHELSFSTAYGHFEKALTIARRIDDLVLAATREGLALSFMGISAYAQGRLQLAKYTFSAAVPNQIAVACPWGVGVSLIGLGYVARDLGEREPAGAQFAEALVHLTRIQDHRMIALALDGVAGLANSFGQPDRAARLFGAAAGLRAADGLSVEPAYRAANERDTTTCRTMLGEAKFTAEVARGATMPLHIAVAEANEFAASISSEASAPRPSIQSGGVGLTPREIEVLRHLAEGLSDREIARTLSISERTAGNHVQHAMQKIGVNSRTSAAVFAIRHSLA